MSKRKQNALMSNKDKQYNGWTNYETWAVNLHISNTESTHDYATELAVACIQGAENEPFVASGVWTRDDAALYHTADMLKDWIERLTSIDAGGDFSDLLRCDLINAALSEVDWHEIASACLEMARERLGVTA